MRSPSGRAPERPRESLLQSLWLLGRGGLSTWDLDKVCFPSPFSLGGRPCMMLEHAVQLTSQPRWWGPFWGTDDLVCPSPRSASAAGGDPSCYSPCAPAPAWHPHPALPVPGAPPVLDSARVGQRGPATTLLSQPAGATQLLLVSTVSAPWGSARVPSGASSPGLPWERAPPPPARS